MLERLLRDHVVMRDKGDALLRLLDQPEPPAPESLAAARWQLSSYMMQHLAFEDRHLYAKLMSDARAHVQETGRRFQSEAVELFGGYAESAQHWTPDRIAADWDGFRSMGRSRMHILYARIEREEAELFPLASSASIDMVSQGLPTRSWARDAFSIKDAIVDGSDSAA